MTHSETIQTLEDLANDGESVLSLRQLHAIYFAIAVLRSMPNTQVSLIDDLLTLEVASPRP